MKSKGEYFISVDIETAGPIPGEYSMLSLGACVVGRRDEGFYAELKPLNSNAVPDALKVTGFDLAAAGLGSERLRRHRPRLRRLQCRLRLVLRQLVLPPLLGREPVRLRPAGHQVLLHGSDWL
jgi:hypothetical protein